MSRTRVTFLILFLLFVTSPFSPQPALAITRAEVIGAVVNALDLPPWGGSIRYPDVKPSHPQAQAIETAAALGVILPTDRFYPDLEATAAETVCLALRAMGFRAEAELYARIFPLPDRAIPPYLEPYLAIAGEMTPPAPELLLKAPRQDLNLGGLSELVKWLRLCRMGIKWEKDVEEGPYRLVLHREGLGSPPPAWVVRVGEYDLKEKALQTVSHLSGIGFKPFIRENGNVWWVEVGPFDHYARAWEALTGLPGYTTATVISQEGSPSRALYWTALIVDGNTPPTIRSAGTLGAPKLPLSALANVPGTAAAINGGFFGHQGPIGTLRIADMPSSLPLPHRTALFWDNSGRTELGSGNVQLYVRQGKQILSVTAVNTPPRGNGVALFTPFSGDRARGIPCNSVEAAVTDGKITWKKQWGASLHQIPKDGFLLAGTGSSGETLMSWGEGSEVELIERWEDESRSAFSYALQAGPVLLRAGRPVSANEGLGKSFTDNRHPRTMVGFGDGEVWWIAVDGRDPWHSRGMTLDESRRFLLNLGLTEGLNLDGGGSTALWWRGALANHPPGGRERPLPYAVIFETGTP